MFERWGIRCGHRYIFSDIFFYHFDRDIVDWFRSKVEEQGGGSYQTMLNDALRTYMERQEKPLEEVLRRVVREELQATQ